MRERRRLERKFLNIYSRVFERNLGKMLGYLGDLSQAGAMIISDHPQTVNSVVPLRLDLPDPTQFNIDQLDVSARVARCDPDVDPAYYNIGLEFLGLEPDQTLVVEKMMNFYEFKRDVTLYPTPPSVLQGSS